MKTTPHRHQTRQLLLAARRGHITDRELADLLLQRLATLCPECRRDAEAVVAEEVPAEAYQGPLARALAFEVRHQAARFEGDRKTVHETVAQLRDLSLEQRLLRIRNTPERFDNLALGQELLDRARACLPDDPAASLAWAETAEATADVYSRPYPAHLVRAVALQGNAQRALGDFDRAELLLRRARVLITEHRVADLDVGAELHSFLASMASDRGRFEEASEHLNSAADLFHTIGDTQALARVFLKLGILHELTDDLPAALRADRAALGLLSPDADPQLYLAARLNYAFHLQEAGRPVAARDTLDWDLHRFEAAAGDHLRPRVTWLRARLAADEGDLARAERCFLSVLDQLIAQEQGFDAALVSLELALLYHDQGRFEELAGIARQAVELFKAYALHQEALSALVLVRDAAQARTLTVEALRRAASFLRHAAREPSHRANTSN